MASEVGLLVEMTEGGMVSEDGEGATFEVDSPFLEGVDDGKHFFLMCGVVPFSRVHLPGNESNRLWPMALVLGEHSAKGEVRGISGNGEWEHGVRDTEDGSV